MFGIYRKIPALPANTVPLCAPLVCSFRIDIFFLAVWRKCHVKNKVGPSLLVRDCDIIEMSGHLSSEIAGRLRRFLGRAWVLCLKERKRLKFPSDGS